MQHITYDQWETEVLQSNKPVLVDFYATWCGPCKLLSPVLEELSQERDDIKIVKVDVDQEDSLAIENNIAVVPTLILFKDGKVAMQTRGSMTKEQLLDKFSL